MSELHSPDIAPLDVGEGGGVSVGGDGLATTDDYYD